MPILGEIQKIDSVKNSKPFEHLSFSSIDTYLTCPMRWYFRYVVGIKNPPAVFLAFGDCGHRALKFNNVHKFEHGDDFAPMLVEENFCDVFQTKKKEIEDWEGENPDKAYDNHIKIGRKLLNCYMKEVAPTMTPVVEPEKEGHVNIGGVDLKYFIDLETKDDIWDYKFVNRAKSDEDVRTSLQMWLYSIARSKENVNLISMVKNNSADIVSASATIPDKDRIWARTIVQTTAKAIMAGVFFPRKPDGQEKWQCTPKFCGYYHSCRGKGMI